MSKETAVQEFNWWVNNHIDDLLDGTLGYEEFKKRMEASFVEFKAMEKEQMKECAVNVLDSEKEVIHNFIRDQFEKYYNETFEL